MKTRLGCLAPAKSDSYTDFTEFLPPAEARGIKLTQDEVVRWADSFDALITHKYGLAAFRAFLKTEFSDENIEFWMVCEDYKKIPAKNPAKLASKGHKIYKEFIEEKSPREVNIDFRTRELARQNLTDPTPSSLNEVQTKVYCLMEKDSYPRFLRSKMYQDILKKTNSAQCRRSL